jgi:hypothetical protein
MFGTEIGAPWPGRHRLRRLRLRNCLTGGALYDRPVRELLADAVAQLKHPSRPGDYVDWLARHYPPVKNNTVRMHITA